MDNEIKQAAGNQGDCGHDQYRLKQVFKTEFPEEYHKVAAQGKDTAKRRRDKKAVLRPTPAA
jgi:hypothetical protein